MRARAYSKDFLTIHT